VLGLLRPVVGDERVGGVEDRLRGAVVLLELDHLRVGVVFLEVENVPDVGASELVDRLGIVPDYRQVAVLVGEQAQPAVLGVVGVLVLIDQHVAEGAAVAVEHLGKQLEEVDAAKQQIVEVQRVHAVDPLLVELVDLGGRLLEVGVHLQPVGLGVEQPVLGVGDLALEPARGEALGVHAELVGALLDQPHRVGLVVDREAAGVSQPLGVGAHDPRAGRVKSHHPHRPRPRAYERLDAVAHLCGRLVGEGDREDLARLGRPRAHEVRDPAGERAGLARAGAGQDQQRPLSVGHRLPLGVVEALEQGLRSEHGRHPSEDRPGVGALGRPESVRGRGA